MNYITGEIIKLNDVISFEHDKTKGVVYDIIDTYEKQKNWGVNENGLMIKSEPFGLVFLPEYKEVIFFSREVEGSIIVFFVPKA